MKKEVGLFDAFIEKKGLRRTLQRRKILDIFLSTERHVSAEELHKLVKRRAPYIGYTTVYRTMKLLSASGLCRETDFGDGILRFEHHYAHGHHDHLICVKCGRFIEAMSPEIEKLQERMAGKHNFKSLKHKLDIFGVCSRCQ